MRRDFAVLSKALYQTIEWIRSRPRVELEQVDLWEAMVAKKISDRITMMDNRLKRHQKYRHEQGSTSEPQWPDPMSFEMRIVSPYAKRFIKLVSLAEQCLGEIQAAYLDGYINTRDKLNEEQAIRKEVRAFTSMVRMQRQKMFKLLVANGMPVAGAEGGELDDEETGDDLIGTLAGENGETVEAQAAETAKPKKPKKAVAETVTDLPQAA